MPGITPVNPTNTTQVSAYDLAGTYLGALGAPDTPANRNALAAWFMAESAPGSQPGTIRMVGNNPLNLTGSGSGGSRNAFGHSFAVYNSPSEGAAAWASTLRSSWGQHYGYNAIAGSLINNSTNGQATISAIVNSGWVTGKTGGYSYQHGTTNSLQNLFNQVTNTKLVTVTPTSGTVDVSNVNNIFGISDGQVLTPQVIDQMMKNLQASGVTNAHIPFIGAFISKQAEDTIRTILNKHQGEAWSPALAKEVAGGVGVAATQANPGNPGNLLSLPAEVLTAIGNIGTLATDLSNPQKWGYTLAMVSGFIVILIGGGIMVKGAFFPGAGGGRNPAPIVVTGG